LSNSRQGSITPYDRQFCGVEEEQQIRFPVTEEIAGPAPVNPATFDAFDAYVYIYT